MKLCAVKIVDIIVSGSKQSMEDLLASAVENVLAFDRLNPTVREKVASIFHDNGIKETLHCIWF